MGINVSSVEGYFDAPPLSDHEYAESFDTLQAGIRRMGLDQNMAGGGIPPSS